MEHFWGWCFWGCYFGGVLGCILSGSIGSKGRTLPLSTGEYTRARSRKHEHSIKEARTVVGKSTFLLLFNRFFLLLLNETVLFSHTASQPPKCPQDFTSLSLSPNHLPIGTLRGSLGRLSVSVGRQPDALNATALRYEHCPQVAAGTEAFHPPRAPCWFCLSRYSGPLLSHPGYRHHGFPI